MTPKKITTTQVVVVFKTHLDVGFTDSAATVLSGYLHQFIPAVLQLAKKSRHAPERYVWTTGSWLVYRFLEEAGPRDRRAMEEAILAGDFHWHALPFTMHSELTTPDLFRAGLLFSQKLDQRFGRKTIAAKMTDVPGHTRGIVPILAEAGVQLLHIGVNPASTVPDVPACFRWQCAGHEIIVIYEKEYGATTMLPGNLVLSVNLTNDNLGPHRPQEVQKIYARLRCSFPQAKLMPGSLDQAASFLWKKREELPIVTAEIGDSWIHGIGTDPVKVSSFRELTRLRSQWISTGQWSEGSSRDLAFMEPLLLVAEHTWGMDIKTHLPEWKTYTAAQLRSALRQPAFRKVASSWQEQRQYLADAIHALPPNLQNEANRSLRRLKPVVIKNRHDEISIATGEEFSLGNFRMTCDSHGSIVALRRQTERRLLIDSRHPIAMLTYQTFSSREYHRFYRQYNTLDVDWARKDFTKWGMPVQATAKTYVPDVRALRLSGKRGRARLALEFPSDIIEQGAPAGVLMEITAVADGLDLRLQWKRKFPTRLPEALWLGFRPPVSDFSWLFGKLGVDLNPLDVVSCGNRTLHGVTGAVKNGGFSVESPDAVLVCPGKTRLLNFDNCSPKMQLGVSYNLYNNVWGTNFPMWNSDSISFRFFVRWR